MKPKPWSFTALDDFINCPRSFHAKRVVKTHVDTGSAATIWGTRVHLAFEERIRDGKPLPPELAQHEGFMQGLLALGVNWTEKKVALSKQLTPCPFMDDAAWWRGVIDFHAMSGNGHAHVVDYKTGKPKPKKDQLMLFALWIFAEYPAVQTITCRYYWTQTLQCTSETYQRSQIRSMWQHFVPSLKQYTDAFVTDTWQPRQSGLCNGWCPVTECEFWKPKRR